MSAPEPDALDLLAAKLRHPSCTGDRVQHELMEFRARFLVEDRVYRSAELAAIYGFQESLRSDARAMQDALSAIYSLTDDERIHDVIVDAFAGLDDGGAPSSEAGPEDCY